MYKYITSAKTHGRPTYCTSLCFTNRVGWWITVLPQGVEITRVISTPLVCLLLRRWHPAATLPLNQPVCKVLMIFPVAGLLIWTKPQFSAVLAKLNILEPHVWAIWNRSSSKPFWVKSLCRNTSSLKPLCQNPLDQNNISCRNSKKRPSENKQQVKIKLKSTCYQHLSGRKLFPLCEMTLGEKERLSVVQNQQFSSFLLRFRICSNSWYTCTWSSLWPEFTMGGRR